jgi:hypothetical protein
MHRSILFLGISFSLYFSFSAIADTKRADFQNYYRHSQPFHLDHSDVHYFLIAGALSDISGNLGFPHLEKNALSLMEMGIPGSQITIITPNYRYSVLINAEKVSAVIKSKNKKRRKVIFGHSLGGALAVASIALEEELQNENVSAYALQSAMNGSYLARYAKTPILVNLAAYGIRNCFDVAFGLITQTSEGWTQVAGSILPRTAALAARGLVSFTPIGGSPMVDSLRSEIMEQMWNSFRRQGVLSKISAQVNYITGTAPPDNKTNPFMVSGLFLNSSGYNQNDGVVTLGEQTLRDTGTLVAHFDDAHHGTFADMGAIPPDHDRMGAVMRAIVLSNE